MNASVPCSALDALDRLKAGNRAYLRSVTPTGDISPEIRRKTALEGQKPFAVIITCSDSRVIPEDLFSCGIGELFVIRVAGNVLDNHQLGSVEYAISHLGCRLVVMLGHTHCGAVDAAIHHDPDGYVKSITDEIRRAIGQERDEEKACVLNVRRGVEILRASFPEETVLGAIYRLEDGQVEFLPEEP